MPNTPEGQMFHFLQVIITTSHKHTLLRQFSDFPCGYGLLACVCIATIFVVLNRHPREGLNNSWVCFSWNLCTGVHCPGVHCPRDKVCRCNSSHCLQYGTGTWALHHMQYGTGTWALHHMQYGTGTGALHCLKYGTGTGALHHMQYGSGTGAPH